MHANLEYENIYWNKGYHLIAGVDEAGRGPLAGPVVAAAVILPKDFNIPEINDSKQLTKLKREELKTIIEQEAIDISISIIDAKTIDRINILEAARLAMKKAIEGLKTYDFVFTDYMDVSPIPHLSLVHGDVKSQSIAAASIIAKVTRDQLMSNYHKLYPAYDFIHNQGYGTKKHLEAIKKFGITPIHRKSFKPIKQEEDYNLFTV
ncbi:MAG TPA: ribonuclease HII [Acholeplasma sp.]|jgi:ribonuclease HII